MQLYESIFIARQEMSPAQVETLTEQLTAVLKENDATVGKSEYCGLRSLAYPVRKNKKGHYILMNVTASPAALKEFERRMRLNEDILRYLSVVVDVHEDGPSALLKASRYGREEGGERGERRPRYEGERGDRPDRGDRGDRPRYGSSDRGPRPSYGAPAPQTTPTQGDN